MRAIVYTQYGSPDVLQLRDIDKPVPSDHEVLIRVRATTASAGDVIMRRAEVPGSRLQSLGARMALGLRGPKREILGMELAGEIEAVGEKVSRFKPGDQVFASTLPNLGFGGYAEYKCLPEDGMIAIKPANLSFEEAAPIPGGGLTALIVLRKANIRPGDRVLIYGASGSVGTYAVQIARSLGAEVTGVCSTANLDLVRSLGADSVIDYTQKEITARDESYDVVFDAVNKFPQSQARSLLTESGIYLNVVSSSGSPKDMKSADMLELKKLAESGQLKTVIDRCYPLEQVADAHRYVEQGHKKGNVVIMVVPSAVNEKAIGRPCQTHFGTKQHKNTTVTYRSMMACMTVRSKAR